MGQYENPKTYVVAWISWFDHELHQEKVEALNEYHALEVSKQDMVSLQNMHEITNMQDLKQFAFDCDGMISVLEIT